MLLNDNIIMLQPSGKTLLSCNKITANMKFLLDPVLRATHPYFSQWKLKSYQHFERRPFRLKWEKLNSVYWSSEHFILKQRSGSDFRKWIKQRLFYLPFCATTIKDLSQMMISSIIWKRLLQLSQFSRKATGKALC